MCVFNMTAVRWRRCANSSTGTYSKRPNDWSRVWSAWLGVPRAHQQLWLWRERRWFWRERWPPRRIWWQTARTWKGRLGRLVRQRKSWHGIHAAVSICVLVCVCVICVGMCDLCLWVCVCVACLFGPCNRKLIQHNDQEVCRVSVHDFMV